MSFVRSLAILVYAFNPFIHRCLFARNMRVSIVGNPFGDE